MDMLREAIWYEKYRPTSFDEMVFSTEQQNLFLPMIENQDFPHLLLYGPQGTGKTTTAKILTTQIPCSVLLLNASGADRGVETMRTTVVQFAASMPARGKKLKVVILDEADFLTPEAQGALRNTIETYSASCRFILTANNVDKIIAPLRSRCTGIEMHPYSADSLKSMCERILTNENVKWKEEDVSRVISSAYPDIRKVVNNLQRCSTKGVLDLSAIKDGTVLDVDTLFTLIRQGNLRSIREMVHGRNDFTSLYKLMFDSLNALIDESKVSATEEASTAICTHLFYESTIPDRELNFAACCVTLMVHCGSANKIKF